MKKYRKYISLLCVSFSLLLGYIGMGFVNRNIAIIVFMLVYVISCVGIITIISDIFQEHE